MNQQAERHRKLIEDGYARFAAGDIEVLRTLVREDFIEHSPGNPSGRDAFIEFMTASPIAASKLEVKRVIADGTYVAVHWHMIPPGDERGVAVVDIWRMEGDQIAEHWDVLQPVPEADQIPLGMF
ncbi:nuclear transport factor 2 family protein [Actinomadura fibrosa]|uniref:Nuclear transport factor 2 family protein n=1 Tax=Actinomadura fibrosa TaxID=111802 RepID=A0ABW2XET2_9ACTN|nr:nuclear transport factor 2 family protein [Actinomadura fibrosa]